MRDPRETIIEPILTEKALRLEERSRQYVFRVHPKANKIEIRKAIEKRFGVRVKSVRTVNVKGKPRQRFTRRGRVSGYTSSYKKAYVTLAEGDKLEFVET
ncbi:MAG: 50S ribosomal protein L23 [Calditrichaeota bacterium]|nr:MAG: 50S ribosomal protein L23 [Calditrichota bacterium]